MTSMRRSAVQRAPFHQFDIVDMHAHLGPYSRFWIPDAGADAMVGVMDLTGTAVAVLSSHRAIQQDACAGNDEALAAVDRHPTRVAAYGVVNPWQDPERELERILADRRFVGVKIHPSLHHCPVHSRRYAALWESAAAHGVPVLTHSEQGSPYDAPALVAGIAEQHPGLSLILGHAGITPAGVDASVELARIHPNLTLEVCGSQLTGRQLEDVVAELGAQRVAFGSDFPFIDQRMSLGRVLLGRIGDEDVRAVLGGTARTLFRKRPLPGPLRR